MRIQSASVFLLFVILLSIAGYYPAFMIERYLLKKEIKSRIKQGVPEDQLHIVVACAANHAQMRWHRAGREFSLNDKMYDIVRSDSSGTLIKYYCILDTEEKVLFDRLSELVEDEIGRSWTTGGRRSAPTLLLLKISPYLPVGFLEFTAGSGKPFYVPQKVMHYRYQYIPDILHPPIA